jgi:hypothetical protein
MRILTRDDEQGMKIQNPSLAYSSSLGMTALNRSQKSDWQPKPAARRPPIWLIGFPIMNKRYPLNVKWGLLSCFHFPEVL